MMFKMGKVICLSLRICPIFSDLNDDELASLQPYLIENSYDPGAVILHQGETGKVFHVIMTGKVEVFVEGEIKVRVAVMGAGDFFGEMSCLTGEIVSATVQAADHVTSISMNQIGLMKLMDTSPGLQRHLVHALVKRIRQSNSQIQQERLRSAIMSKAINREGEARYGEIQGNSGAVNKLRGDIKRLAAQAVPVAVVGESGTGKNHVASRLHYEGGRVDGPLLMVNSLEFNWNEWDRQLKAAPGGTIVLKKADQLDTEALAGIIRSSDDVRVIFTGTDLPDIPGVIKIEVPPLRERRDDIPVLARGFLRRAGLADADNAVSSEALRKLMIYPFLNGNVEELFRVIQDALVLSAGTTIRPEHLRLGRYRPPGTRPTIGLALGSGAVRGCAHVGVLKVFEEERIPIDYIAGSSVGAIVGVLYSAGMKVGEIERLLSNVNWKQFIRWIWPKEGLTDNSPMGRWLEKHIGRRSFADLLIPFATVASDANTGESVVMKSGPVDLALRAATAIPFIMRPVRIQDRSLVDGGMVHRVPAALVRSMGADIVIAVDVDIHFENGPARTLMDSLLHAFSIMSEHLVSDELEMSDIVIKPAAPVSGFSFKNAAAFFERGEQEARNSISKIKQLMAELA
jgi:predicted acylesterase/phospholipase RssA/CRP-like cAMP-binding protein